MVRLTSEDSMRNESGMPGYGVLRPEESVLGHDTAQLSKLSSILNGLEGGAQVMRRQIREAQVAVKAGTYYVDPVQLSRRIVGEALRSL